MGKVVAVLLLAGIASAPAAARPDPPRPGWFRTPSRLGAARPYDLAPARAMPFVPAADDILVERWRSLPPVRPEPEHRDVFETDPVRLAALDGRLASTRSVYRDGCHAGSVCYSDQPNLFSLVAALVSLLR